MEFDGEDSLFEGMVLFTPLELDADLKGDGAIQVRCEGSEVEDEEIADLEGGNGYVHQPRDERLFSELTSVDSGNLVSVECASSDVARIDPAASRRKRRAPGRRVGYGRDTTATRGSQFTCESVVLTTNGGKEDSISTSPRTEDSCSAASRRTDPSIEVSIAALSQTTEDSHGTSLGTSSTTLRTQDSTSESRLEQLKSQAASDVARATEQCASISASLKDCVRRRRKIEEDLNTASADHQRLETELQDACEREDFDSAQRISDSLAASEDRRRILLESLRNEKTIADALDSQMHEALLGLITVEQQCAALFRSYAHDVEQNVQTILITSKECFSKEMDEWVSSSEALNGTEIALGIESYCIDELRGTLSDKIKQATEADQMEKDSLCRKKDSLAAELHDLLALAKKKEAEIAETDSQIMLMDEKIAKVVGEFQQIQSVVDSKHDELQSTLSELLSQSKTLISSKEDLDHMALQDQSEVSKLKDLVLATEKEAESYEEVAKQRKSIHEAISKSREQNSKLADWEEKLIQQVEELQNEVASARASLQDLTSMKSTIHQKVSSYNQRLFFIDKRIPELEAEKKVAAAVRNFGDAARITAAAKSLHREKEELVIELDNENTKLQTLEQNVRDTASKLVATEELMHAKEKEMAMAKFQMLRLSVATAKAERSAALELEDAEEADLLLREIELATSESIHLETKYGFKEENFTDFPKQTLSLELVANLGKEELARVANFVDGSSSLN